MPARVSTRDMGLCRARVPISKDRECSERETGESAAASAFLGGRSPCVTTYSEKGVLNRHNGDGMAESSPGDAGGSQPSQWTRPAPQRRPSLEALEAILTSALSSDDGGFGFIQSEHNAVEKQPASFTCGFGRNNAPFCAPGGAQMSSVGAQSSRDMPSHPFLWHHHMGELTEWQPGDDNQAQQPTGQDQVPIQNTQQVEGLMAAFRSVGGTWEPGPESPDGPSPRKAPFLQPRFPPRISVSSNTPSQASSRHNTPRQSLEDSPRQSMRGDTPRSSDTLSDCGETTFRSLQGGFYAPFATTSSSGITRAATRGGRFSSMDSGTSSRHSSMTDDSGMLQGLSQLQLLPFASSSGMHNLSMPRVRPDGTNQPVPVTSRRRSTSSMISLQHRVVTSEAAKQNLRAASDLALLSVTDEIGGEDNDLANASTRSLPMEYLTFNGALEAKQLPSTQPSPSPAKPLRQPRESITTVEDNGMASDSTLAQDDEDDDELFEQQPGKTFKAKAKQPRRRYAEHQERFTLLEAKASELLKQEAVAEADISKAQGNIRRLEAREMELLAIDRVFALERKSLQAKLEAIKGKLGAMGI